MNKPGSSTINIQDSFFYQLRKDARPISVFLVNGKRLTGILRRFDRYAVILEDRGEEQLVYKHAIASIVPVTHRPQQDDGA